MYWGTVQEKEDSIQNALIVHCHVTKGIQWGKWVIWNLSQQIPSRNTMVSEGIIETNRNRAKWPNHDADTPFLPPNLRDLAWLRPHIPDYIEWCETIVIISGEIISYYVFVAIYPPTMHWSIYCHLLSISIDVLYIYMQWTCLKNNDRRSGWTPSEAPCFSRRTSRAPRSPHVSAPIARSDGMRCPRNATQTTWLDVDLPAVWFEGFVAWKPAIYHLLPLKSRNWLIWIETLHDCLHSVGCYGLKLTWVFMFF